VTTSALPTVAFSSQRPDHHDEERRSKIMTEHGEDMEQHYSRFLETAQRGEELLQASGDRAQYEELLHQHAEAEKEGTSDECASLKAQIDAYEVTPPVVTHEELLSHYTAKADALRPLAARQVPESAELLAETEQQIAHLSGTDVEIVSFGFLHGEPPAAHLVLDLREHFRDPHVNCESVEMTTGEEALLQGVLDTEGVADLLRAAESVLRAFRTGPSAADCGPPRIAVGCARGRRRGPAVASALYERLTVVPGLRVDLTHRDIGKPHQAR
jgi:hypothetical protein